MTGPTPGPESLSRRRFLTQGVVGVGVLALPLPPLLPLPSLVSPAPAVIDPWMARWRRADWAAIDRELSALALAPDAVEDDDPARRRETSCWIDGACTFVRRGVGDEEAEEGDGGAEDGD